ncbi:Scr1 family TA system antitoxin-like transcriptional regulator [Amycolatopsis sp. NPDC004772]
MTAQEIRTPASLTISNGLREVRDRQGIGLRELARRLEINPSKLSGLEVNGRRAKPTTVSRILGCLQVKATEYEQLMNVAEHVDVKNYIDQSTSPVADLWAIYEQLSTSILEWAPFRIPDFLRTHRWLEATVHGDVTPTTKLDRELFHRRCRQLPVDQGERQYVFLLGDQALRMLSEETGHADQQIDFIREVSKRRDVSIRIIPSTPAPRHPTDAFTIFASGTTPIAIALQHDHCTAYLTSTSLQTSSHQAAKALLRHASDHGSTIDAWMSAVRARAS